MRGLIAPLQRKSGRTLAEEAGHCGPDRIQRMLNRIEWDADEVLDDVRRYVVDHLGDREAVLIVDDTGFLRKGTRSAGVQRQYSGTAGRTEDSQIGGVPRLRHRSRTHPDRPTAVSAHVVDGRPGTPAAYGFSIRRRQPQARTSRKPPSTKNGHRCSTKDTSRHHLLSP